MKHALTPILIVFTFFMLFGFTIQSICFGQQHSTSLPNTETITKKIENTFGKLTITDSFNLFANGYVHLIGKIGKSNASIEINIFHTVVEAYIFCDSLESINGFNGDYKNGILKLSNNNWLFCSGNKTINQMYLAIRDSSIVGYAIQDSLYKEVKCVFYRHPSGSYISLHQDSFSYKNQYNNFPVCLSELALFADTSTEIGRKINLKLLQKYDLIGLNYNEVMKRLSFTNLVQYKTVKDYKKYCLNKFIAAYKHIINKEFLENAKESGHQNIYLNSLSSKVIWNDGNYLVIQIIMYYADGDAYPYYDTGIFEYDLNKNTMITFESLNKHLHQHTNSIQDVIANLKKYKLLDSSAGGDNSFLYNPQIAFYVKGSIVLYRTGGNHGIHYFYKYYPYKVLAPLLN